MKKRIIISAIAVVLAAGIGTGVYFGARANKSEPTNSISSGAAESTNKTTTEEAVEYGEFNVTKEEYDRNMPVHSNPVQNFEKGKYYAPISYIASYGTLNINWGSDGRTVTIAGFTDESGFTVLKLNEYGEVVGKTQYDTVSDESEDTRYVKNVMKPTEIYNESHRLIAFSDSLQKYAFEHDEKGNITKAVCGTPDDFMETFEYDANGNIVKFVIKDYYKKFGDGGYWENYDSYDRVVTARYELNSLGIPVRMFERYDDDTSESERELSYAEVSEAQYNFYNYSLKAKIFAMSHSTV